MSLVLCPLFELPSSLILSFCENWVTVVEICYLDSALACESDKSVGQPQQSWRSTFLNCITNKNANIKGITVNSRVDIHSYRQWVSLRSVATDRQLHFKQGYKYLCKKIPSWLNGVSRVNKTESRIGGVFNYTPDTMENFTKLFGH